MCKHLATDIWAHGFLPIHSACSMHRMRLSGLQNTLSAVQQHFELLTAPPSWFPLK